MDSPQWVLTSITARGYLGIGRQEQGLELNHPVVVLTGPNGSGKSTWVSSIEWAIFGDVDLGNSYDGIPELSGNRAERHAMFIHIGCDEADVVLHFRRGDSTLVWRRVRRRGRPQPHYDVVTCLLDGKAITPDSEEVFGVKPELYRRTVAPRQTTLRALVTLENSRRNEALDDLFGIRKLNNLTVGLSKAKRELSKRVGELDERFVKLADRLRDGVAQRFDTRTTAREVALEAGVEREQLSVEAATSLSSTLAKTLSVKVPHVPRNIDELATVHKRLETAAASIWAKPGPQDRLDRLQKQASAITSARSPWQRALGDVKEADQKYGSLVKEIGDEKTAALKVDQATNNLNDIDARLAAANSRAAALAQARDWLSQHKHAADDQLPCPVCERLIGAADLVHIIDEALNNMKRDGGEIGQLESARSAAQSTLEEARRNQRRLTEATKVLAEEAAVASDRRQELLRRMHACWREWDGRSPDEYEKPVVERLKVAVSLVEGENQQGKAADERLDSSLRSTLEEMRSAVEKTTKEMEEASAEAMRVRKRVSALSRLIEFLKADASLRALDKDVSGTELAQARSNLQTVRRWSQILDHVNTAAEEVSISEAERVAGIISPALNRWFARLSHHDLLRGASLTVEPSRAGGVVRNAYRIRAMDESETLRVSPGPMISGGYEMLLTISALCALTETRIADHRLGLLVLDEPTESLDGDRSRDLGLALGGNAPSALTVITTIDPALAKAVEEGAGSSRTRIVHLAAWTKSLGTRTHEGGTHS